MKRRSARPFMVEVKHTRASRTALTTSEPQARPVKVLWPELIQAETKPMRPAPEAAPVLQTEAKEPDAPVRRVLPSLVPMFQGTAEPEAELEAEPEPRPRRARRERAPAVAPPARQAPRAEPVPESRPPAIQPAPAAAAPVGHDQDPAPRPAPAWRRTKELRLGERWKRRLPPYCR